MERILVSRNGRTVPWEALARSIALAKRIDARLYVLTVLPQGQAMDSADPETVKRLDRRIKDATEDGVRIDSFLAEGNYEQEVINFAQQNKITLLVTEHGGVDGRHAEREWASLQTIRHRVSCRVEIVTARRPEPEIEEDGT